MTLRWLPPTCLRAAILILAAFLNFHEIDRVSLWNDEAFSFFVAHRGIGDTLAAISHDTQPPFYYLVLSVWLHLGHSVFVIRALSAVAVTLAVLPVYGAAQRLFNHHVATLASLLFAIAPLCVTLAQRARPYPLQSMLVALAFWGFACVATDERARLQRIGAGLMEAWRERSLRPAGADIAWLAYALGGALAMLTQQPAGFFILGCNVAMALLIFRGPKPFQHASKGFASLPASRFTRRGNDGVSSQARSALSANHTLLGNWVIAQLVLIGVWGLWVPAMLDQFAHHLTPEQIAAKHAIFLVTGEQVLATLESLFSVSGLYRLLAIYVPLYALLALFSAWCVIRRGRGIPVLAPIAVPIGACLLGFWLIHPVFGYAIGTFAWILVPYTVLIAAGLMSIRPMILRLPVVALVLLGNAWGVKNAFETDTPPLDKVAALIAPDLAPGDGVVLSDHASGRWGLAYYLDPVHGSRLAGLGLDDWNDEGLIRSPAQARTFRRLWFVTVEKEPAAVDPAALFGSMRPAGLQDIGPFHIGRLDGCQGPCP